MRKGVRDGAVLYVYLCALIGVQAFAQNAKPQAAGKPNVVLIMADDLGYGDLSCYGNRDFETPHLDVMAAGGMRFTDYHSNGPVCSPTRAALLTGRYQQRAGLPNVVYAALDAENHDHGLQPEHEFTFAEAMKQAGYATALFGKWHLGYEEKYNPVHHGFDRFIGYVSGNVDFHSHIDGAGLHDWWHGGSRKRETGYTTHLITKHAVRFIEDHKDGPFCLYIAHEAPHYPFQGPGDKPVRVEGSGKSTWNDREDEHVKRAYREMVQEMDKGVGEVVSALKRHGLAENTLVIFCSDNGATQNGRNGALRGTKGQLWEGGHRVPAIAYWPGRIKAGSACDELVMGMDWMATMMGLAGVESSSGRGLDGVNLLPVMLEGKSLGERRAFWAYNNQRAMRDGDWKLVIDAAGSKGASLYNLAEDISERHDLSRQEQERVRTMREAMAAWERDVQNGATVQPSK